MLPFINILGYQLPTYGLSIAIAVFLCGFLALRHAKKLNLDENDALLIIIYTVTVGFIGAKILFLITILPRLMLIQGWFTIEGLIGIMSAGFVFYGGVIGGAIGALICKKAHKVNLTDYLYMIIYLPLAHGIGRIGCFLAGCCYGIRSSSLGIAYRNSIAAPNGIPLLPIQLIEAVGLFLIFIILYFYEKRNRINSEHKTSSDLNLIFLYVYLYAPFRFILEYFRGDAARGSFLDFSTSQWISAALILIVIVIQIIKAKSIKKP
jgi:phosphatidylglycerol:prolipoprotein diacylglycerol transferase